MTEVESEQASLLARYRDSKIALLNQLDRVEASSEYQPGLRQAVQEWLGVARNPTLPAGVHYLLERHPDTLEIDTTRGETAAVVKRLRDIARDEDIEVFITVLEFGPGEYAQLVHIADFHENETHEYFDLDKQEVLQSLMAFLEAGEHALECLPPTQKRIIGMAIVPTSRVLKKIDMSTMTISGALVQSRYSFDQWSHEKIHLEERMMCYLADRVLDKNDVVAAESVLEDFARELAGEYHDERTQLVWPRKVLEKMLLNAVTMDASSFSRRAKSVWYEPPLRFFEDIAQKLRSHSPGPTDSDLIHKGLSILISRVELLFSLPFLRDLSLRHDRTFWADESQSGRPWYGKFFRLVLLKYVLISVGGEPPRCDFRRPGLSMIAYERTSCWILNKFLLDRSRVRAIFPIELASSPAAERTKSSGHVLRQTALAHILPLLAARKRNCAFHLKDSTCGGTVLCVKKRDGSRKWDDWSGRRDKASEEIAKFDRERLKLILGGNDYEALVEMDICKRGYREERDRTLARWDQDRINKLRQQECHYGLPSWR